MRGPFLPLCVGWAFEREREIIVCVCVRERKEKTTRWKELIGAFSRKEGRDKRKSRKEIRR